ncbi:MAG: sulfite exporter TauE/SafE family protein [Acidimicrobiia bacterium]
MDIDLGIALAGLIVGFVVGLTGMGGGALMTPILVIGFGIEPLAAVSSDLVAAVVMKPIGGGIHFRRGTVHMGLVRWLMLGSVPGALLGSYVISHLGNDVGDTIKVILGVVLLIAAAAMVVRSYISRHRTGTLEGTAAQRVPVRQVPTLLVGFFGGVVVGMTSVGSGSLMIVAMMLLYPMLSSRELVGTDLVQAVPLVTAAAIGHIIWGDFVLGLTGSLLLGSIPGVILGAHVSSRAPDGFIRPVLALVLVLSGLKLLDVPNEVLAVILVLALIGGAVAWFVRRRRVRAPRAQSVESGSPSSAPD